MRWSIPLLRRGGSREATDGVVGHLPAHAQKNHPGGSAATPPKEGNSRLRGRREAPTVSIPLLRRGGRREATDGVVGHLPAHVQKTTPAASPPPLLRRGIFCQRGRREAPTISFPSLGGVAGAKRLTGWSVTFLHTFRKTTPAAPPPPLLRRGIEGLF